MHMDLVNCIFSNRAADWRKFKQRGTDRETWEDNPN